MHVELPVCKRCCFCIPLRYGLLIWVYVKLVSTLLLSFCVISTLYYMVIHTYYQLPNFIPQIIVFSITLAVLLTDILFSCLFIIGGHKKNVKLLRVYYFYFLSMWILIFLLAMGFGVLDLVLIANHMHSYRIWIILLDLSSSFTYILTHAYFLLLLRSEIMKLRSNCEFRFVNNAAEAECTLEYKEDSEKQTDTELKQETFCKNEIYEENETCKKKRFCNQKACLFKGSCHRPLINEEED